MTRNKIPHSVKGINGVALFCTFHMKRGKCMTTRSRLTNSTMLPKRVWIAWEYNAVWKGGRSLVEETIMCGVQGKEAFTWIKGGRSSHRKTCYWVLILVCMTISIFSCLTETTVLLSTRISCLGILLPYWEASWGILLHLSAFRLKAKPPPSATMLFL